MKLSGINANWFDLVVLAMLVIGLIRGRKRGMSGELLPLLQWLLIVFVGAYTYEVAGQFLHTTCHFELTHCNIGVYVFDAIVLKWLFTALKHVMGDKLLAANVFGRGEYFCGMFAGAVRFGCMVLMCMALLHAYYVPPAPPAPKATAKTAAKSQEMDLSALGFFSVEARQQDVFSRSLIGPFIQQHLSTLLLKPAGAPSASKQPKPESLRDKRERLVDEATKPK